MKRTFRYKFDKRSKRITWAVIVAVVLATAWFTYAYIGQGAYYPAWFFSTALAVAALYILSIPRWVRITHQAVEIHCVVELTTIQLEDIRTVRRLDDRPTGLWLLLGSYGFFGYYGYYFDFRRWQTVNLYASQWRNFVEIEDIYDQRCIISCADPDVFVQSVETARRDFEARHPHVSH